MKDEAYRTAWGIYHVVYETKGYWFRTPEAWDITGNYRASMYMRPGAIWAMELAQPAKITRRGNDIEVVVHSCVAAQESELECNGNSRPLTQRRARELA